MQTMSELPQVDGIERQLLTYFEAHPSASDTAEGIGQWWMKQAADAPDLASALDRLVERGILERVVGSDRQLRYRTARKHV